MLKAWSKFQNGRWWWRIPAKDAVWGLTLFLVCFPYPSLFVRNLRHWRNPNALIEPDAADLQPWITELRPQLDGVEAGPDALKVVEKFVYRKVPYAWDWDTWGVMDYMPTVSEIVGAGAEDCDGRAVISASLLRNLGYKADLVTDAIHVWVKTDRGETMSPGRLPKLVEGTEKGIRIRWASLLNIPKSMAYGIGVFPLVRELTVLVMFWILALRSGVGKLPAAGSLVMMLVGLVVLRQTSDNPWHHTWTDTAGQWFAVALMLAGAAILHASQFRARRAQLIAPGALTEPRP